MMNFAQQGIMMSGNILAYDPDYQAVLDRAIALGYALPSSNQQVKQNQLVLDLKFYGIWSLLDVFYVFATDAGADFATLNWKFPSNFQCTQVSSPTFINNVGFSGNGTTSYLNTNWVPSTDGVNYTLNNASHGAYVNNNTVAGNFVLYGTESGSNANRLYIIPRGATSIVGYGVNGAGLTTVATNITTTGFYHSKRSSSGSISLYKNNVLFNSTTNTSQGLANKSVLILAFNGFSGISAYSTFQCSMFFAGSDVDQANMFNSWNTYFTSL